MGDGSYFLLTLGLGLSRNAEPSPIPAHRDILPDSCLYHGAAAGLAADLAEEDASCTHDAY